VTNFNNGLDASSDSDDEDKLHIVEEDSLQEPEAAAAAAEGAPLQDDAASVLPHNGLNGGRGRRHADEEQTIKEECVSEDEEEVKDTLVEEILQQGDTAIIYPEAPEDEQSPAETGGADENGTPDSFSQLHTCPYCSRGYKRNASLKEHIKYRHETSEDNYSCSHCSYTFTYRSQLERHMSHHRGSREQTTTGGITETGGTRKFKCTECFKAFKYKHHLKEHLRIHSGEKPYECSNCKKRFSHSGSYSSHISSKKCVAAAPVIRAPRTLIKTTPNAAQVTQVLIAPGRGVLKEKTESKPLQEQLPVTQIKAEPVEYECKPTMAAAGAASRAASGAATQPGVVPAAAVPQGVAMVVPTVGLMSPISINLNDLQNVLKVAMDGNVLRQVLGSANGAVTPGKQGIVVQQPQQQIISLPAFVDHDGTTKIIINYSIDRAATPDVADLSIVKTEPDSVPIAETEAAAQAEASCAQVPDGNSTCLLCDDCPENLEALHLLQHQKAANGEAVDSAALDPSFADLLSEAGVTLAEPPVDDLLSLLKSYFASNANPNEEELAKLSESVSIPVEVVRKWFVKMNSGKHSLKNAPAKTGSSESAEADGDQDMPRKVSPGGGSPAPDAAALGTNAEGLVIVKSEPEEAEISDSQAEPLDLSLPKHLAELESKKVACAPKQQEKPLNLACLRKDGQTIYVAAPQTGNPVNIVTAAQLPTLVAIAGQGPMGCLSTISTGTKRTILIPQLTYTYATAAKTVVLNGHKEASQDSSSEGVAVADEQSESDLAIIKKRRLENGVYPCDLCSKVFQKGSSLLRHKYEHTGKRPHECSICKKAFKHKHHLIEHSRLHSGEKPYQCDKCGKRFSHSGSYSQHMNHRYSYCKKDGLTAGAQQPRRVPQSDSPTTTPPSQLDSDERESEEEEEDE
uniref:Zinc finger E-box binding homeobox 1 n=1 Tax=Tetraodon nigroviridis TaxID=99883 RepID=H3CRA0_TETNG